LTEGRAMSTTTIAPAIEGDEQRLDLFGIKWDQYVTINDALPERRGLRMLYLDGRLTFLTLSRRHDWNVDFLDTIIKLVATGCGIEFDVCGSATLRAEELKAGVEGDRTYYFGPNAEIMGGPQNIDLSVQPPPDLAIEVELSHSANQVMAIYARPGVPEVWRLDPKRGTLSFLVLGEDGAYRPATHSRNLPLLKPEDVSVQLKLAAEIGSYSRWYAQLNEWVRTTILPRAAGG
jgi:Uma2 family endonuclease